MRKRVLLAAVPLMLGASGCGIFRQPPPPTPLEVSWNRYQLCVHQARDGTAPCERLRLAYEAQLNRAPK